MSMGAGMPADGLASARRSAVRGRAGVDHLIVGAGPVGVALAGELARRRSRARILLVDQETAPAFHKPGHGSGVLRQGMGYARGSQVSRLFQEGHEEIHAICQAQGIEIDPRGELFVARDEAELGVLTWLALQGSGQGIDAHLLGRAGLRALEPEVEGVAALHVPATAIADCRGLMSHLLAEAVSRGVELRFGARLGALRREEGLHWSCLLDGEPIDAGQVTVCSGLEAARIARMQGIGSDSGTRSLTRARFVLPAARNRISRALLSSVPAPGWRGPELRLFPAIGGAMTLEIGIGAAGRTHGDECEVAGHRRIADPSGWPERWRQLLPGPLAVALERGGKARLQADALGRARQYLPGLDLSDMRDWTRISRAGFVDADGCALDDLLLGGNADLLLLRAMPFSGTAAALPVARLISEHVL